MEAAVSGSNAPLAEDIAKSGHGLQNGQNMPLETISRPRRKATLHECNPILYGPREGADCVRCRTCAECLTILQREQPDILKRDLGVCMLDMEAVDPDEEMAINERECWRERQF